MPTPRPRPSSEPIGPRSRARLALALAFLGAFSTAAAAADGQWGLCGPGLAIPPPPAFDGAGGDPNAVHVSADSAERRADGTTRLRGNVEVRRGTQQMRADEVLYNQPQSRLDASGDVRLWDDGLYLSGEHASLEVDANHTTVENAGYVYREGHAHGGAAEVELSGRELVKIQHATYTTCNPDDEAWKLVAGDIRLDRVRKVGTAHDVRVDFQGYPIFYSPYLTFPLSSERKSGFLVPHARVSGSTGVELTVPYYFNLAPNYDATLAARGMTDRGVQLQGQFRYLTGSGSGALDAEVLPTDRKYGGARGAVRFHHGGEFDKHWSSVLDFNWVSDRSYFEDLGTSLEISSQTFLQRLGELTYASDYWRATGRVQSYQTIDRTIAAVNRPYQRLPQLLVSTSFPERNWRPNLNASAEFVHFDRQASVTGTRVDVRPSVSFPMRSAAAFVVPAATVRYTGYALDGTAPGADNSPYRLLPSFDVDSGMYFERNVSLRGVSYVQTLEPRLYYLFVPFDNQTDLPVFDTGEYTFSFAQLFRTDRFSGADRMGDAHQLTLALTSRLLAPSGQEFLRASIGQIHYFRDRRVTLPGELPNRDGSSPVVAEVSATPTPAWRFSGGVEWDPNHGRTDKSTVEIRYKPDERRVVNASYRLVRGAFEQGDVSFAWPIAGNWRAVGRWDYALDEGTILETFAGVEYDSCCWGLRTIVRRYLSNTAGGHDNAIFVQLELKGLAGVGDRAARYLERTIPGYRNEF